jgi:hypothetical protein
MSAEQSNDPRMLRNLAAALHEVGKQGDSKPKLAEVTDEDILRAMLGKPWNTRRAEPVRKAG